VKKRKPKTRHCRNSLVNTTEFEQHCCSLVNENLSDQAKHPASLSEPETR
jgi:hypothetical protein